MNKTNRNATAVIYARFSSDMQREESIDAQIRACREYATRSGIQVIGEYIDRAKSATSDQRPEFQRMVKDSENGQFSMVIVHKLDRFSRSRYDSAHYKHQLKRNDVVLRSVIENIDDSPESIIMESVLEGMAEYYSKNLAREVMKGLKENALQGKHTGGTPPLGYDVDKDTRLLVINPREAEAVKLIFSMYLNGSTYGEIGNVLNQRGLRTKAGKQFGNNSLHSILKNPKYTGTYVFSRMKAKNVDGKRNSHAYKDDEDIIKVEGVVPALVSKEDFERVQECMKVRKHQAAKHKAKRTYLLSGKIYCGECGMTYVGNCRMLRNNTYNYLSYRCNNKAKRPRCDGWEIRAETLEGMILNELANIVFNDDLIPELTNGYRQYLMEQNTDGMSMQRAIKSQITEIQKDIDSIVSVIVRTSSDSLVEKLNELDNRKKELTEKLRYVEAQCQIKELTEEELLHSFTQAREMLKSGELSTVKALIERYVQKVIINGEHIEVQFNLNVNSRVVNYPADVSENKKQIPQFPIPKVTEVSDSSQMLATLGAGGGT